LILVSGFTANLHRVREPSLRHYVRARELKAAHMDWTEVLAEEAERVVAAPGPVGRFSLRGDLELAVFAAGELRRSYAELPVRWMYEVALHPRIQGLLAARASDAGRAGPKGSWRANGKEVVSSRD
jgi:hypothetical protein